MAAGRSARARAREFKASGNKAMAAGAFGKALRQYSRALELEPGSAVLYSNRAATHFNLRQFAESLEDAESAILCDEAWWKAYKRKGLALIHMQRYEDAIAALEEGIRLVGESNREMEKNLEFARACQEQAQNLYILPEPDMMERLESVPVFIVTDDVGQPFFVTYEDGQQVCTFYFDKVDADATLQWIQDENPDIGGTARVIHITLNQAFSLAQETQKQYYEETTRAAVEEDLAAKAQAEAAKAKGAGGDAAMQGDVDGVADGGDEAVETGEADAEDAEDAKVEEEEAAKAAAAKAAAAKAAAAKAAEAKEAEEEVKKDDAEAEEKNEDKKEAAGEGKEDEPEFDDSIIDENAPLSFQFRPELRQVQVAVELLNANPNPPVRPILRDPPSVKEAKAKAKAEEEAKAKAKAEEETKAAGGEGAGEGGGEGNTKSAAAEGDKAEEKVDAAAAGDAGEEEKKDGGDAEKKDGAAAEGDEDDEELNVENFNGIPVFQAKGLTFLQNNQQLVPLFCSKWDLEAAWDQLVATPGSGVSGKCEVEVGTLEDVLRRMSENKTGEFENVIFVPAREAMKAIGQRFPLDDFSRPKQPAAKPVAKKASLSRAREIKARGGSQAEIRAAIEEDLKLFRERQRVAEMVASINQAAPADGAAGATGRVPPRRPVASQKPISGHERREALRKKREAAGLAAKDTPGLRVSGTTAPSPVVKKVDTESKEVAAETSA